VSWWKSLALVLSIKSDSTTNAPQITIFEYPRILNTLIASILRPNIETDSP